MPHLAAEKLIQDYYEAFNSMDVEGFLALLTEDVVHDVNQGERETGKLKFRAFLERMNRCYEEKIVDIFIMSNAEGTRAAAEFTVLGVYLETDEAAAGGRPALQPAGGRLFEIRDGRVARISNTYNLNDWMKQVAG